jgi:Ca2+/Na+ antiporter
MSLTFLGLATAFTSIANNNTGIPSTTVYGAFVFPLELWLTLLVFSMAIAIIGTITGKATLILPVGSMFALIDYFSINYVGYTTGDVTVLYSMISALDIPVLIIACYCFFMFMLRIFPYSRSKKKEEKKGAIN